MNLSSGANLLVNNVVNAVRSLEMRKSQAGDDSSSFIKSISDQLRLNKVPATQVLYHPYIEEIGCNIDFYVEWDGKMFLTSSDSIDDFKPILGQTIESRVNFVKLMPSILRDMETSFLDKIEEFDSFINEDEDFNEDDLIPEEMSEEEKDFMMMDGIED